MTSTQPRDYSLIAPIYDQVFNRMLSEGHRKLGALLQTKKRTPGIKVLEVGVGSGLMLDYVPTGLDYHGIDVNKNMLSLAHVKAKSYRRKKIALSLMDAHKLTLPKNSFDLVMAASVLSAVDHPEQVMKEMVKVTKKGGYIAVITNLRQKNSRSNIVKAFDPFTKRFLGFRTDLESDIFNGFKEIVLVEKEPVNNLLGFPLSTYLLFQKK